MLAFTGVDTKNEITFEGHVPQELTLEILTLFKERQDPVAEELLNGMLHGPARTVVDLIAWERTDWTIPCVANGERFAISHGDIQFGVGTTMQEAATALRLEEF